MNYWDYDSKADECGDYCVRCGVLLEPDGLMDRAKNHPGLCIECEEDDAYQRGGGKEG